MKYNLHLLRTMLPEWREAYINYKALKLLLFPFKHQLEAKTSPTNSHPMLSEFIPSEKQYFREMNEIFIDALKTELLKFAKFAEFQILQSHQQWQNLISNLATHEKLRETQKTHEVKLEALKDVFHQFYSKIHYLQKFLSLNSEILYRILKKYHFQTLTFNDQINFRLLEHAKLLKSCKFTEISLKLHTLTSEFVKTYKKSFYTKKNRHSAEKVLHKMTLEKQIPHKEAYLFCFLAGFSFVLCCFVLFLALDGQFEDQTSFFNQIFPIFRGASFIVLYTFLLAWNVYGWTRFNINYRRIFKFNHHYSTLGQILKRAIFFWSILLITFLWYVLIKTDLGNFSVYLDFLPEKKYIAIIIWVFLFGYLFFPSRKYCNGQGRIYVFKLLHRILFLSCFQVDFVVNWATDQLVSFVTPLKDLEYTFCFYFEYGVIKNDKLTVSEICSEKTIYIGFVAASLPLFLRMVQCARLAKNNKEYFCDILNFFKYFSSLMVAIFSFISGMTSQTLFFNIWVFFAVVSTIYSYSWDIKMDWGLLKTKNLLREKLLYDKKYYYFAIVVNLLFRCSWIMTISNGVDPFGMPKEVFNFVFGFIEMFRRAIWNFMRVEKEYIFNTDRYKLYEDIRLPYPILSEKNRKHIEKLTGEAVNNNKKEENSSTFATKIIKNEEDELQLETYDESNVLGPKIEGESLKIEFEVMEERANDLSLRATCLMKQYSNGLR